MGEGDVGGGGRIASHTHTAKELQVNPNDSMQESSQFFGPGWAAITASKQPARGL